MKNSAYTQTLSFDACENDKDEKQTDVLRETDELSKEIPPSQFVCSYLIKGLLLQRKQILSI